jgi:hypothetical protein
MKKTSGQKSRLREIKLPMMIVENAYRMTLLVTIFLVLINIHNTIQTNSPKVSTTIPSRPTHPRLAPQYQPDQLTQG